MDIVSLFLCLIVGLFIYAGSLCGLKYLKEKKFIDFSISITFGMLATFTLFRLIPHSFKTINGEIGILKCIISFLISILIGFFLMKTLDMFIKNHSIKSKSNNRLFHLGMISTISFMFLNIMNGVNIYIEYSNDIVKGIVLAFILCICNIALGLFILATLTKKLENKKVLKLSILIALLPLLGYLFTSLIGINILLNGIFNTILIGVLIYILLYEMFYQIYYTKNKKLSKISIYIGVVLVIIIILLGLFIS